MASYLRRRVGTQILVLLLVITALMQVLELLDVTTDVLKRDQGFIGIVYYGLLRLPASALIFRASGLAVATMGAGDHVVIKPVTVGVDLVMIVGDGRVQAFGPKDEVFNKTLRPVPASGLPAAPAVPIMRPAEGRGAAS